MRMSPTSPVKGFSLIELMIAMAIGVLVLGAVLTFVVASVRSNLETVSATRITQELRVVMNLMTREIRRAGYDRLAERSVASSAPGIRYTEVGTGLDGQCIVIGYNRPAVNMGNGAPVGTEWKGFRLDEDRSVLQANVTSNRPVCGNSDGWIDLTDPDQLTVSQLEFVLTETCVFGEDELGECVPSPEGVQSRVRDVIISLSAASPREGAVTRELVNRVRIRADDVLFPDPEDE